MIPALKRAANLQALWQCWPWQFGLTVTALDLMHQCHCRLQAPPGSDQCIIIKIKNLTLGMTTTIQNPPVRSFVRSIVLRSQHLSTCVFV